jgi:sulfatase maturation enzyme AslB (radical SAM superfamily)
MLNLGRYIDEETFSNEIFRITNLGNEIIIFDCFISDRCNLNCKHCYYGNTQLKRKYLTQKDWYSIIENAIANGIKHFHFSGRESLLNSDIFSILQLLSDNKEKYQLYYGLITNGVSVEKEIYENLLSTNIDYIEFSIDGTKSIHNDLRGNGTFEKLINTLTYLAPNDKINTSTTISNFNINVVRDLINLLSDIGIKKMLFAPLKFVGNAKNNKIDTISSNDLISFIEMIVDWVSQMDGKQPKINLKFCLDEHYSRFFIKKKTFIQDKLELLLEKDLPIFWDFDDNIIELALRILYIPYLQQIAITSDGFLMPFAADIHRKNYYKHSLCNINDGTFEEILSFRKVSINKYINNSNFLKV